MVQTQSSVPSAIRCHRLSKSYGEVEALRPLDLEVPAGSIFGFLGRNGAGKTTTIRLMTGLAHPTSGSAWVNGVETTRADSSARQQFGYLPQDPAFYNWMTPRQYLDYVARLFQLDSSVRAPRVDELLEQVDLSHAAKRKIGGFSGGMIQRLGIAQALVHEPPVLFLDEPTSSLDPAGRYDVLELIDSLRGRVTVFLSSHILGDIERVCDWVAIIHEGRLLLVSRRDELLSHYATKVLELGFDPADQDSQARIDAFVGRAQGLPWVSAVTAEGARLRIAVHETGADSNELLRLILDHNLVLDHYAWVKPSLEEIFLKISE